MGDEQGSSSRPGLSGASLRIEEVESDAVLVLKVSGMATVEVCGQLSRSLQEAAKRKPKILAVDLSGLSFISSTGLGSFVAAHVTCERNGVVLCLINPKPFIRDIFEVTRLTTLLRIRESLEEARQLVQE